MFKEDKPFFLRRLPDAVRRRLADEARTSERTLTAEIIHRLRQSLRTSNQAADPAPLSTSETKSRPACDHRAARSAVFDPTYPAAGGTTTSLTMQKISMPATVGKFRNSFLPRNGRHPAVVQQWSNEVRLCTISPNGAPDHFDAVVNGELLVPCAMPALRPTASGPRSGLRPS